MVSGTVTYIDAEGSGGRNEDVIRTRQISHNNEKTREKPVRLGDSRHGSSRRGVVGKHGEEHYRLVPPGGLAATTLDVHLQGQLGDNFSQLGLLFLATLLSLATWKCRKKKCRARLFALEHVFYN